MEQNLVTVCETFVKMIENLEGSVNFLLVIVKIEAGPGRAGDPPFFHQRLGAMVATSQCQPLLVCQSHQVMYMKPIEEKTYQTASVGWRTKDPDPGEASDFIIKY